MHFLGKTLSLLSCFILYSKAKLACYSRYLLTSSFCIPVPCDEKDIFFFFFLVLVLKGLVGLHRTVKLHLLWHYNSRGEREKRQIRTFIDSLPSARSFMAYLLLL